MDAGFERMGDRDGNSCEQFQSTGFDTQVWELYLLSALEEAGSDIE